MGKKQGPDGDRPPDTGGGKPGRQASSKEGPLADRPEPSMPSSALRAHAAPDSGPRGPRRRRMPTARSPSRAVQDLWVGRLRERDPEVLREIIAAFEERLTAVVAGLLRDRDAVEDVVQEAFVKAWYRIASFKGGSSLYTWLYRVAVNAAKDYIKSRRRRPSTSFEDVPGVTALAGGSPHPIEGLEQRERRLAVRIAIDKLPIRFRAVLALREIEGMAYHQIAEVLDLSLGTVESRLFRARRRLRALLVPPPERRSTNDRKGREP